MTSIRTKRRKVQTDFEKLLNDVTEENELSTSGTSCIPSPIESQYTIDSYVAPQNESENVSDSDIDVDLDENEKNGDNFKSQLVSWAVTHNITSEPLCSKGLLKTPTNYNMTSISGGQYHHFGIQKQICNLITDNRGGLLEIIVGIDGLPISKSSKKQFWPILGICEKLSNIPFIIGLYYSLTTKPLSVNEFLEPFVQELIVLKTTGFIFNNVIYKVQLKCIVADAPARNFIKCTAAFNGYNGCDRCIQKGSWSGRVIFKDNNAILRTDLDFINQSDKSHHSQTSPLVEIGIGLVSDVVLDYMHLICLGVVKKLLVCWKRGPLPHREGRLFLTNVSERLVGLRIHIPTEFNRKPRTLIELDFWKATEYRTFLLFTGPVVLKGNLNENKYLHFLYLSVAIRILLSDNIQWYGYAKALLKEFVIQIPVLYTEDFLVYNVHSLIHLADDALKFGSLNNVTAFPFENFMQTLKKLLRAKNNELAQVIRRVYERQEVLVTKNNDKQPKFKISTGRDSGWKLQNGDIIVVHDCLDSSVRYRKFLMKNDFFTIPCASSKLEIFELSNLSPNVYTTNKSNLTQKLVLLPILKETNNNVVCFPMF